MLCISGHARHVLEASVHPASCHSQPALSSDRQTRPHSSEQKVAVHATNTFNLNLLRTCSLSCRPCSLAIALHARSHGLADVHICHVNHREIFKCGHLKFMISGRSKQTNKHTHTRAQCSHTSVGLTQAHPNYSSAMNHECIAAMLHVT